jgi:uncharacterized membrane protein
MSADPEVPPTTTPPPSPNPAPASAGSGLSRNTAAGLASLFSLVGGLVFFFLDRKDPYVRFYSIQSIALGAVAIAFNIATTILTIILGKIPFVGGLLGLVILVVSLAIFVVWLISTINAFRGKEWQIPFLWDFVKKYESRIPQ